MGKNKLQRKFNSQINLNIHRQSIVDRSKTINFDKKSDDTKLQLSFKRDETSNKLVKNLILNCPWAYLSIEDKIDLNTTQAPTEKIFYHVKKKPKTTEPKLNKD